jgi:hypothetical protein
VIFHGVLAAAGDEEDVLDAGGEALFDAVLDDGRVDQRQHLLGNDLGGGQKAGAQSPRGEDSLANAFAHGRSPQFRFAGGWRHDSVFRQEA